MFLLSTLDRCYSAKQAASRRWRSVTWKGHLVHSHLAILPSCHLVDSHLATLPPCKWPPCCTELGCEEGIQKQSIFFCSEVLLGLWYLRLQIWGWQKNDCKPTLQDSWCAESEAAAAEQGWTEEGGRTLAVRTDEGNWPPTLPNWWRHAGCLLWGHLVELGSSPFSAQFSMIWKVFFSYIPKLGFSQNMS